MTRTLSLLGAALPAVMIESKSDNEKGFWESQAVVLLNDEILQGLDSDWEDVFSFRPKRYLSNFDRVYLGKAVELLNREFIGSELIVLKDPRISILTEFWHRALQEAGYAPHYIIMVRNPLEVAESLRIRNGFPPQKSLLLWGGYMIAADRETRGRSRTFVAYDQLMDDWRSVRDRFELDAGIPFPRDTANAAIEIDRHLDRRLRHHNVSSNQLVESRTVPDEIKTLYAIFSKACEGNLVDYEAVGPIAAELEKMDLLVGPVVADLRASSHTLARNVAELERQNAAVHERADLVEEQLAAERALRQAEAEGAARSGADFELQLAELGGRLSEAQAEQDRAMADALERDRQSAVERETLEQHIAAITEDLQEKETAFEEVSQTLKNKAEELSMTGDKLQKAKSEVTRVQEESKHEIERATLAFAAEIRAAVEARSRSEAAAREEMSRIREEAEREKEHLRKALEKELRAAEDTAQREARLAKEDSEREIERARGAFARDLQEAEQARGKADAAARAIENKLAQQYRELATLTNLLRDREQGNEKAEEQIAWLVSIHERLSIERRRWWAIMPNGWRRKRALRSLQRAELFDGEAYLRLNPDVAAAGMDPLDHFMRHGFWENRPRD